MEGLLSTGPTPSSLPNGQQCLGLLIIAKALYVTLKLVENTEILRCSGKKQRLSRINEYTNMHSTWMSVALCDRNKLNRPPPNANNFGISNINPY